MNNEKLTLPETLNTVWTILSEHVFGTGPERPHAILATSDMNQCPQLRAVSMRSVNRATGDLEIYTDLKSHKVEEITHNPNVSVLVWRPDVRVQLRLSGTGTIIRGEQVADKWHALPPDGRLNYSHQHTPGRPIKHADDYDQVPSQDRFAVLKVTVRKIDYVSLAESGHSRAEFSTDDDWQGQWLSP